LPRDKFWSKPEIDWFTERMSNSTFVAHVDDILDDVHNNNSNDDFRRLELSMIDVEKVGKIDIKTEMITALGCRSKE
jgi:hypothetical protein